MICKVCGTDNAENAKFCKTCGNRLDGVIICPACRAENSGQNRFCDSCGTRLKQAYVCARCGAQFDGNFCPVCGAPYDFKDNGSETYEDVNGREETDGNYASDENLPYAEDDGFDDEAAPVKQKTKRTWRSWTLFGGSVAALTCVALCLLFTFFINVTPYGNFHLDAYPEKYSGLIYGSFGINLKWIFSDCWDLIGDRMNMFDDFLALLSGTEYVKGYEAAFTVETLVPVLFTLAVYIATIIAVAVNSVLAIVRWIFILCGKQTKSPSAPTLGAYLSYVLGAFLIKSFWCSSVSGDIKSGYSFGAVTVVGLVFTSLLVAGYVGSRIAVKAKNLLTVKNMSHLIMCGVAVICISVVWGCITGSLSVFRYEGESGAYTSKYGAMQILQGLNLYNPEAHIKVAGLAVNYSTVTIMSVFSAAIVAGISACCLYTMRKLLTNAMDDAPSSYLVPTILIAVLMLFLLIFVSSGANSLYNQMRFEKLGIKKSLTPTVVAFTFSVIALAISIAQHVIFKMNTNKKLS